MGWSATCNKGFLADVYRPAPSPSWLLLLLPLGMPDLVLGNDIDPSVLRGPAFGDQAKVERLERAPDQTDEQRRRLDVLAYEIFDPPVAGLKYNYFRVESSELFKRFGVPTITDVQFVRHRDPGPNDPADIEKLTWAFPGMLMQVTAYPPSAKQNPEKVIISRVEISSEGYNLQNGLRAGLPAAVFIARLGNPNRRGKKHMQYFVEDVKKMERGFDEVSAYQIEMSFDENEIVRKISWTWEWH